MALLTIETHPSEVLNQPAKPVETFDEGLRTLAADMFETMYQNGGIGLAAPQVGRSIRMVVLDLSAGTEAQGSRRVVLVNPEITKRSGSILWEEGCLSLPGILGKIKRSLRIVVSARDLDGQPLELAGDELLAVAIQHELDHLDGILFTQRVSPLQRKFLLREYARKQEEESDAPPAEPAAG
ncbi:MAG: peptide deformylase [Deltaproteobacteria bacterium]|nr:peptide deformylase [Deltaproteobacteria bacterium]